MGRPSRLALLILPTFFVLPESGGAQSQVKLTPAEAARGRQERSKTVYVKFKRSDWFAAGSISNQFSGPGKAKAPVPAQATREHSESVLILNGEKARYENDQLIWDMPKGQLKRIQHLCVFTGTHAKSFIPTGMRGDQKASGIISSNTWADCLKTAELTPLWMTFRGASSQVTPYLIDSLKPAGGSTKIHGRRCEYYRLGNAQIALSPEIEHSVCQIEVYRKGNLRSQTTIRYRYEQPVGWVPTEWKYVQMNLAGHQVARSTDIEVTEYRFNGEFPQHQFDIVYPPGCFVTDQRKPTPHDTFYVEDDGNWREVSPGGALLPGTISPPDQSWLSQYWLLIVIALLVLAILGGYVWKRRRWRE